MPSGSCVPLAEGRALMAATYSSTKWPGRAPAGKVLLRGFVGGPHNQEILKRSDGELVQTVLAEFRDILGLNPNCEAAILAGFPMAPRHAPVHARAP